MKKKFNIFMLIALSIIFYSCEDDDFDGQLLDDPILNSVDYDLGEKSDSELNGTATINELESGVFQVVLVVDGTSSGNTHPAHIHMNSALEGGDIILSLEPIDGDVGTSITTFTALDDGTEVSFDLISNLDAYINVHLSADELGTIVAQGDIGENALTGNSKTYELGEKDVDGISGSVLFQERENGEALATITLEDTPEGGVHPAHIHMNTAVETGGIIYTFTPVDGTTGMSMSNVSALDDGTEFGYADVLEVDGYVNVHLSSGDLGTIVAQGDIGQNELTGESKSYDLGEKDAEGISGSVLFEERENGEALATISLDGTPDGGVHPAHIHMNTAVETGGILFTFTPVDGTTGMSMTNVSALDDTTEFGYEDVLEVDGYVNVHLSALDLGTIVAQGDIGQNGLTGESKSYDLGEKDVDGISGSILFEERENGEVLATISLDGTPDGGEHPAHIHMNTALETGGILFTFNSVDGTTGMSQTNMTELGDEVEVEEGEDQPTVYAKVLDVDGYVNVHLSGLALGTIVAQGDIGQNELTGASKIYALGEKDVNGISGSVLFEERVNGEALATISLAGTPDGGEHPAHIHSGTAAVGGPIIFTFNPVNGTTGTSLTNVAELDDETDFGYAEILEVDGYVNVHLSSVDLGTIVAQGNIGANE